MLIRELPTRGAQIREHHGWRRHLGYVYESEINAGIGLFEPGYNPIRVHRTLTAAERRCERWLNGAQKPAVQVIRNYG